MEAVSAAGFCLFTAQTVIPAALFHLGPNHFITRLVGKILTHSDAVVRLMLAVKPLLHFNAYHLLPQAEAIRLATGIPMYSGSFMALGERGYNLERLFNLREGLTAADDSLPDRLTKTPQPDRGAEVQGGEKQAGASADAHGSHEAVAPLEKMLARYYKVRGWDAGGVPTARTLKRLKLQN